MIAGIFKNWISLHNEVRIRITFSNHNLQRLRLSQKIENRQVTCTDGFSCETRPRGFHRRTGKIDFVTSIPQVVQTICNFFQNLVTDLLVHSLSAAPFLLAQIWKRSPSTRPCVSMNALGFDPHLVFRMISSEPDVTSFSKVSERVQIFTTSLGIVLEFTTLFFYQTPI